MMMRTKKGQISLRRSYTRMNVKKEKLYTRDSRDSVELVKTIHHVVEREG